MSLRVVVVCEDHRLDQHVLRPILAEIFRESGRPAPRLYWGKPQLQGLDQALSTGVHEAIVRENPMADAFLLVVDRDCDLGRPLLVAQRILKAESLGKPWFACVALEEIETWALALHRSHFAADWAQVRAECHPKEVHFEPLVKRMGWFPSPGKGRSAAMNSIRGEWGKLKAACQELETFSGELIAWLKSRG